MRERTESKSGGRGAPKHESGKAGPGLRGVPRKLGAAERDTEDAGHPVAEGDQAPRCRDEFEPVAKDDDQREHGGGVQGDAQGVAASLLVAAQQRVAR